MQKPDREGGCPVTSFNLAPSLTVGFLLELAPSLTVGFPLETFYLLRVALGRINAHDRGAATVVAVIFNVVRLFFVNNVLKSARSAPSAVFQPFAVAVNSLHAFSKVSI